MIIRHLAFILITTIFLLYQQNCGRATNSGSNENGSFRLAPDERSSIVFFFKKELPINEQTKFSNEVLSVKAPNNRGLDLLPGVNSTLRVRIHGFDGFAINFLEDATVEQEREVMRRLQESPLVYKVYRNAIPNEIDDL